MFTSALRLDNLRMLTPIMRTNTMDLWQHLSQQINQHSQHHNEHHPNEHHNGRAFHINAHTSLAGGCINSAYKVSDGHSHYFVKLNRTNHSAMFETEAHALQELYELGAVRVPRPICSGQYENQAYLVLEYLPLSGSPNSKLLGKQLGKRLGKQLGQQLAATHRVSAPSFGWRMNNVIGATPQSNQPNIDWIEFWRNQRLIPQLQLAEKNGYARELSAPIDKLLSNFKVLFATYSPAPSLLHGDLWGGNVAALADGTPVMFDPALYYGDRETDLAMTHLFGGFDPQFYAAYNEAWPLDEGFALRKTFYNLYHILNHLNLFGSGYLGQAVSMTEQILAEI